ncbi:MAG: hypothetical protein QXR53_02990 [Candidatus Norongarragalinales archaeon]
MLKGRKHSSAEILLVLTAVLAGIAHSEFGQGGIFFGVTETNPIVNITNIVFSPSQIVQGSTTDVSVYLENTGGTAANTTVNITIFYSNGSVADVIQYDPTVVASGGTLQIIKSYNTDSRPLGTYTANGTGYYSFNSSNFETNTFSTTFQIIAAPPEGGGGGGGTGGDVRIPAPTTIPPELKPAPGGGLEFTRTTVLKEVTPGTNAIESIGLKNNEENEQLVRVNFDKAPWVRARRSEFIMLAKEEQTVNLLIDIPENAKPGDYLAQMSLETDSGVASEFMAIRVKPKIQSPIATKTIFLDRNQRFTLVKIQVENPSDQLIPKVLVEEEIPRALATEESKLRFLDKPGVVTNDAPLSVAWTFSDILPQETDTISYQINTLLGEYSTYAYWPIKQVVIPDEVSFESLVRLVELHSPTFAPGEEKEVTARIYYTGLDPLPISASLSLPESFQVTPSAIERTLQPASFQNFVFKVKAPQEKPGTYIATFYLNSQAGRMQRTTTLILAAPEAGSEGILYLAGGLAIVILLVIVFTLRNKGDGVQKEEIEDIIDRETYLREVKGILKKGRP